MGESGKKGGGSSLKGQFERKKNQECLEKVDLHLTFVEDNDGKVCVGQHVTDIIKNLNFIIEVFRDCWRTAEQGLTSEREDNGSRLGQRKEHVVPTNTFNYYRAHSSF